MGDRGLGSGEGEEVLIWLHEAGQNRRRGSQDTGERALGDLGVDNWTKDLNLGEEREGRRSCPNYGRRKFLQSGQVARGFFSVQAMEKQKKSGNLGKRKPLTCNKIQLLKRLMTQICFLAI